MTRYKSDQYSTNITESVSGATNRKPSESDVRRAMGEVGSAYKKDQERAGRQVSNREVENVVRQVVGVYDKQYRRG